MSVGAAYQRIDSKCSASFDLQQDEAAYVVWSLCLSTHAFVLPKVPGAAVAAPLADAGASETRPVAPQRKGRGEFNGGLRCFAFLGS